MFRKLAVGMSFALLIGASWWGTEQWARAKVKTKAEILQPTTDAGDRHTEKVTGPLSVRVELDGSAPEMPGDVYKVVGYVQSSQTLDKVRVTWLLSGSAQIISGAKTEVIGVTPDSEVRIEITVKATRPGVQRVGFRAAASVQGSRFAAAAHYTNAPAGKDFVPKTVDENEKSNAELERKIFQ